MAQFEQKVVRLANGRRLSYFEFGNPKGYPMITLTGHLSSGLLSSFVDDLARKNNFRIISPNYPGIGASDFFLYSLTDLATDLKELANIIKLEDYMVTSYSAGVAMLFAFCYQNPKVKLAVALSAFGPYNKISHELVGIEKDYFRSDSTFFPTIILNVVRTFPSIVDLVANSQLDGYKGLENKNTVRKLFREDRRLALANGTKAMVHQRALLINDWTKVIEGKCDGTKLIFIHGAKDISAPCSILDWYQDQLPLSQIVLYPEDNHFAPFNHLQDIFTLMKKSLTGKKL